MRSPLFAVVLLVALIKSGAMFVAVPPFQAPDEYGHYDYVLYLSHVPAMAFVRGDHLVGAELGPLSFATREVPCLAEAVGAKTHFDDAARFRPRSWAEARLASRACQGIDAPGEVASATELHQLLNYPPLYYAAAATIVRTLRAFGLDPFTTYLAIRLASVALLLLTLLAAWRLAGLLHLAPAATAGVLLFTALQPQLSLLSVSVQPDMLGLWLVTLATAQLLRLVSSRRAGDAAAFGALIGLLLLTKLHLALPLGATSVAVGLTALASRRSPWREVANLAGWAGAAATIVGGWWYLRSLRLFGNALGVMPSAPHPEAVGQPMAERALGFVTTRLGDAFVGYWGRWGWLDFGFTPADAPALVALSLAPLVLVAMFLVGGLGSSHTRAATRLNGTGIAIVASSFVLFALEMAAITLIAGPVNDQGRHWLPFVFAQGLIVALPAQVASHRMGSAWTRLERRGLLHAVVGMALLSAVAAGAVSLAVHTPLAHLSLDLRSNVDSVVEVYTDSGSGFNRVERERVPLRKRDGWHRLDVPLRGDTIHSLRFDLLAGPGEVEISTASWRSIDGRQERTVDLSDIVPLQQVDIALTREGALVFRAHEGSVDPQALLRFDLPLTFTPTGWTAAFVTVAKPLSWRVARKLPALTWLVQAWWVLLLVAVSAAITAVAVGRQWPPIRLGVGYVVALALLLLGVHAWLITEARTFYAP